MADKNIKKETKKKKKSDSIGSVSAGGFKEVVMQPELIKKKKKPL